MNALLVSCKVGSGTSKLINWLCPGAWAFCKKGSRTSGAAGLAARARLASASVAINMVTDVQNMMQKNNQFMQQLMAHHNLAINDSVNSVNSNNSLNLTGNSAFTDATDV